MLVPEFSYYINLGLWYFKLLLVLSFPVIGYVIRRKWLFAVAKEAEIKRLMRLAAEEDAKAQYEEAEEMGFYSDAGVNGAANRFRYVDEGKPVRSGSFVSCGEVDEKSDCAEVGNECAVCLSPTTSRCARCKSVWYCSAKCQFYHWRKGHRDNCRPPGNLNQTFDGESLQLPKAFDNEKAEIAGSVEAENAFSDAGQTELLRRKRDYDKVDVVQDVKGSNPTRSFSSTVSLGSSSSSVNSDSSDDTSIPESSSSSDCEKTIGCEHINSFVAKSACEIKPSGVKGSKTTDQTKLSGQQTTSSQRDSHKMSSSSTTSIMYVKGSVPSVHKSGASDFWEGALDYGWSDAVTTKPQPTSDGLGSAGSSMCHTPILHGKVEKRKASASFRKVESWTSEVYPSLPSTKIHTQTKAVHSGVFNTPGGHKVKSNSSANVVSPQSSDINRDVQNLDNLPLLSSTRADRTLNVGDQKSKPRHSSASNGDLSIHNMKEDTFYQVSNVPHSLNATPSLLSSEKLQRPLNSSESNCTVQSLKCSRLDGGSPLNYQVIHPSINSGHKAASNMTKISVASSNTKFTRSDQYYSPKDAASLETSACKAVDPFNVSKMSRSKCSGTDESHDNKGLFSYELFKSLYRWNQVELRPRGLVNCGNSCFANAVLQCLSFTPPLTAYLLQGLHSKSCSKRAWCFTCEFENLIRKANDGNSPISPIKIISHLPNIGSQLSNGREEDAHEFFRYVVDIMQSICMKEATNGISRIAEEESTLLGLTFGGYLQSKIRCVKCGGKSEHPERIMDLSVEIEGSIRSLHDALKQFTLTETLDAENKYNCGRCKSYQKAKKKLTILEAPNILTIALKRFQVGKFGKLNKRVDFPEVLDMAPYMSRTSDDKAPVYKLYGVIVHLDTMNATFSGHYVCYVKNVQNKWFLVDDSVVKTVEFRTVREQSAYMLLYARCFPRAPKSLRDKSVRNSKSKDTPLLTEHSPFTSGPNSPNFDYTTCSRAPCYRHHVKFETDSYSDNSSLFSSCSGYSCSTDSGTWESNSDGSSPFSSPLGSGHHPLNNHHPHMGKNGGTKFFLH